MAVRYFTIDYERHLLHPDLIVRGPRSVEEGGEWTEATWFNDGFDALDYGLEIVTGSGAVFSLTWDPPGDREGIGLQPVPLLGTGVRSDADVATWSVEDRSGTWAHLVGTAITGLDLHYRPWDADQGSLWCSRITFRGERGRVEVVMGDSEDGRLVPSADNVAVLQAGRTLPRWLA